MVLMISPKAKVVTSIVTYSSLPALSTSNGTDVEPELIVAGPRDNGNGRASNVMGLPLHVWD